MITLGEIKEYLSEEKLSFDEQMLDNIEELKAEAIAQANEPLANELWCLKLIGNIQKDYLAMYDCLRQGKYRAAWSHLGHIEIALSHVRRLYPCEGNLYQINFIGDILLEYEMLFPYQWFMSRESVVKNAQCSICGHIITPRNRCAHKIGQLYMGQLCKLKYGDFKFIGISLVQNPTNKYTVLDVEGKEYDYSMLVTLMGEVDSPYEKWSVTVTDVIRPEYEGVGRNQKCPCGSGKKYKKCCMGTTKELMGHFIIDLHDKPDKARTPMTVVDTFKDSPDD